MDKDMAQAKKLFDTAMDLEEKGKAFYEKALADSKNDLGREIFTQLRDAEINHMEKIRNICSIIETGECWYEKEPPPEGAEQEISKLFRNLAAKQEANLRGSTTDVEALEVGIGLENESIKLYDSALSEAAAPKEKKFLELILAEERDHLLTLKDMKQYLTDPESWFIEMERANFDGA